MSKPPRELGGLLRRHDRVLVDLTLRLREIVIGELAPCHEYIYSMRWKIVLFYGATERVMDDGVCAIFVFRKQVNLGFPRGVDLDDPHAALAGTGVGWRHIKVKARSDLDRPEIPEFLRKARDNAGARRLRRRGEPAVVTRVKPKAER